MAAVFLSASTSAATSHRAANASCVSPGRLVSRRSRLLNSVTVRCGEQVVDDALLHAGEERLGLHPGGRDDVRDAGGRLLAQVAEVVVDGDERRDVGRVGEGVQHALERLGVA